MPAFDSPIKPKLVVMYICICSTHMSVHMPTAPDNHLTRPDLFLERYFDKDLASGQNFACSRNDLSSDFQWECLVKHPSSEY
jgi:hypothetical protein